MRSFLSLTLLLAALPLGLPAQPSRQRPVALDRLADRLLEDPEILESADLSEDQVGEIRDLVHEFRVFQIENRAALDLTRLELDRLWESDAPDAEAIHDGIDKTSELQASLHHRLADLRLGVREVLTPEQRETIEEILRVRSQERRANVGNAVRGRRDLNGQAFGPPPEGPPQAPRPPVRQGPEHGADTPLRPSGPPLPSV